MGRTISSQTKGLAAASYGYDARGRLTDVTLDSNGDRRQLWLGYDANGYLSTLTDSLGHTTSYANDIVGRTSQQTTPDLRHIGFTYDANGNLVGLTPPGRPAHQFSYDPVDQEREYTPPGVAGVPDPSTWYDYNLDRQLTRIARPDNRSIDLAYHATKGQLTSLAIPRGVYGYTYHAASGKLAAITAPDGGSLSFGYDGSLLKSSIWNGAVSGRVDRTYNQDFNISTRSVNGGYSVAFQYDKDQLLTAAGSLGIYRDPQKGGLITATSLGSVTGERGQFSHCNISP